MFSAFPPNTMATGLLVDRGLRKDLTLEESSGHSSSAAISPRGGTRARAFAGTEPLDAGRLAAARDRDPEALEQFFQRYSPGVYRLASRMAGERRAAEEIAQEVFYRAHRAIHRLDVERDPEQWLVAITCNACRRYWRVTQAERRRSDRLGSGELLATQPLPPDALEREQQIEAVQKALADLPDPLRETVVLHAYNGMGHDEIAQTLGISHAAARKRYSRAVAELGRRLGRWLGREHP